MDYGLLQGLGEGLQAGVGAYGAAEERKMRQRQLDEENRRKADEREFQMAQSGLMKNETGGYEKTLEAKADKQAARDAERVAKRNTLREKYADNGLEVDFDENDNVSQVRRGLIPQKAYTPLDPVSAAAKSADIRKTEAEISKLLADSGRGGGKQLPADKVLAVQEGKQIPKMLEDLKATFTDTESFGPIKGLLGKLNPYDTKSATANAQISTAAQSFGRYMEGGVLRKEDEEKYRKMFPNLTDTPEVAANKLALVERMLKSKSASDVEALGNSGYDVSAFGQGGVIPELPAVLSQKSSGLIPEAQAAQGPKPGAVQDGYKFKGGDPSNPNSWEKVQ